MAVTPLKTRGRAADQDVLLRLRAAQEKMSLRAPGSPAIEIPLDKVLTFSGDDGPRAVLAVNELVYLVDRLLRDANLEE